MDSLLDYINYRKYDPITSIFENHKSFGFILRVSHFSGVNEAAKAVFRTLITSDLPVDVTLQVINYASPRIGKLLDLWYKNNNSDPIFAKISNGRYEFFKNISWNNILGNRGNLVIRDFELYFCFSCPKSYSQSEYHSIVYKLKALQEKFTQGLKSINSDVHILDDKQLISFLSEILNPDDDVYRQNIKRVEKQDSISNQDCEDLRTYLESNNSIEMNKDGIIFNSNNYDQSNYKSNYYYSIFEVIGFPEYWDLESGIDYIGNFEKGLSIPCPFYITMGFSLYSREVSQRMVDKHRMIRVKQNDSRLPMFFPKMLEESNDWQYVAESLNQGERMGKMVMYVVLINKSSNNNHDRVREIEQILQDHFARLRFNIAKVHHDCINIFLTTLPFGVGDNWQKLEQLKISNKALSSSCINLMPVFADSQNYYNPLMLFVGRRGQLFFFDNFKTADGNNGNFNMVVVGASGRGKSVWLQEYSMSLLRNGGQVVIIDDGRSFMNTCELLEGDFVDFGGGNFCLNPFSLYKNMEKNQDFKEYQENFEEPFIDLVVSILCIIISLNKSELSTETGLYRAILVDSVNEVMRKKGRNGGFNDIRDELKKSVKSKKDISEKNKEKINDIILILKIYTGKGRYAKYFNGQATLDIKNKFTVFELSDLERVEVLQSAALLTVTFLVYAKISTRNIRTALIIDEFWRMGKHPVLKDPIGGFSRRGRKYNLSLIVASQCMSDFESKNSEAGAIALSQADWRIILSIDSKDEEILDKALDMRGGEIAIAHTLRGIKGVYSEFMIRHHNKSWQIGRLLLDPFSAKCYSTKAEDIAAIKEMKKQGIGVVEAIETLIDFENLEKN